MAEETMSRIYLKIPVERAGVLIGNRGSVKAEMEKGTGTSISVDGRSGEIVIECPAGSSDPTGILKVRDLINAIGRGFSPQRAFRLFTDGQMLEVIDLKQVIGDSRNQLVRVKGRIIGENGKTRRIIESLAGTAISVYGHTVSLIGDYDEMRVAKEAIEMLLKGAQHGTVYRFLNKEHLKLKKRKLSLWEERPELKTEGKEEN
jgi:ribosomal RNA assembly protein